METKIPTRNNDKEVKTLLDDQILSIRSNKPVRTTNASLGKGRIVLSMDNNGNEADPGDE